MPWGIVGDQGAEVDRVVPRALGLTGVGLCVCRRGYLTSALDMEIHTEISSRQMAWAQAYETRALHVVGQCEMSIITFICLAINCSAEANECKYR